MEQKINWIEKGLMYKIQPGEIRTIPVISRGVYNIILRDDGWWLEKTAEEFTFDYKIYDLENDFIDYSIETYNNINGNMGILFNGIKGTGKTVSAKILANKLNIPIIIVKSFGREYNDKLMEFISSFNFNCVLFFDEFEKNWDPRDTSILQIMDGVYNTIYKKVFLLTTNETTVNYNLLSRPSRIRYIKQFGNISKATATAYLKDHLKDLSIIDNVLEFIDLLEISTIDILKSIAEEINIHGYDNFIKNKSIFNVKTAAYHYSTFRIQYSALLKKSLSYENFESECNMIEECMENGKNYRDVVDRRYDMQMIKTAYSLEYMSKGSHFGYYNSEHITKINAARNIVETVDSDNDMHFLYFIRNANTKPSIYGSGDETYAYDEDEFEELYEECEDKCENMTFNPCIMGG